MYPKLFIENFWRGEEREEVFVCMPIDDIGKFHTKLENMIKPAIRNVKLEPKMAGSNRNEITQEIIDSILHTKILIFDLSNDPDFNCKMNGNVLYELGFATSVRNPSDLVLIREEGLFNINEIPFDIRTIPIYFNCPNNNVSSLEEKLNYAVQQKDWQKHKLLEITKNSMDPVGFALMDQYYQEKQIFYGNLSDNERVAAIRLIEFGILSGLPAVRGEHCERLEYSYRWTPFGQEVKEYLKLNRRPRG